jgi:hypothetical protein
MVTEDGSDELAIYLTRTETDEEMERRIQNEERMAETRKRIEAEREARELQQYQMLKEKFKDTPYA